MPLPLELVSGNCLTMKPNNKLISIHDNEKLIGELLSELVLDPRINALKWSSITKQTPNMKIGYPGQHLASLITGIEGERTGARGNDLRDGSEVKSCSRIDQLDSCKSCDSPVSRLESTCSQCGSSDIDRKNDSKWLFSIRTTDELNTLLHEVKRVFLMLADYPNFDQDDFETIRFQAFEIWPEHPRNQRFAQLMTNYYKNIYLAHKKKNAAKNPAPKNFWPYSYQFYICNPVQIFDCVITNANTAPKLKIHYYVEPSADRSKLPSVWMPTALLKEAEFDFVVKKAVKAGIVKLSLGDKNVVDLMGLAQNLKGLSLKEKVEMLPVLDERMRDLLPLRDTDKISVAKKKYARRINH